MYILKEPLRRRSRPGAQAWNSREGNGGRFKPDIPANSMLIPLTPSNDSLGQVELSSSLYALHNTVTPFPACAHSSSRRVLQSGTVSKGAARSWWSSELNLKAFGALKALSVFVEKRIFLSCPWQRDRVLRQRWTRVGDVFGTLLPLWNVSAGQTAEGEMQFCARVDSCVKYVCARGPQEAVNLNGLALNKTTWPTLAPGDWEMQERVAFWGDADGVGVRLMLVDTPTFCSPPTWC